MALWSNRHTWSYLHTRFILFLLRSNKNIESLCGLLILFKRRNILCRSTALRVGFSLRSQQTWKHWLVRKKKVTSLRGAIDEMPFCCISPQSWPCYTFWRWHSGWAGYWPGYVRHSKRIDSFWRVLYIHIDLALSFVVRVRLRIIYDNL